MHVLANTVFIPDFLERRIYANVLKLVIGVVEETIHSTHLDLLGHKLSFKFEPIVPSAPPPEAGVRGARG